MSVAWRFAETQEDAELVRQLRNQGREWFGDSSHIEATDQRAWWEANKGEIQCVLVGDPPVGYGMVRAREDRSWVSLAVDPCARGFGWGRAIYELLAQLSSTPIYAAVRRDNAASLRAAARAGYVVVPVDPPGIDPAHRGDWIVMRYPSPQEVP